MAGVLLARRHPRSMIAWGRRYSDQVVKNLSRLDFGRPSSKSRSAGRQNRLILDAKKIPLTAFLAVHPKDADDVFFFLRSPLSIVHAAEISAHIVGFVLVGSSVDLANRDIDLRPVCKIDRSNGDGHQLVCLESIVSCEIDFHRPITRFVEGSARVGVAEPLSFCGGRLNNIWTEGG